MEQQDPLKDVTRRTERYWYEDGLWEISFGLVYAALAGYYILVQRIGWFRLVGPISLISPFLQVFVMLGIFWVGGRLVKYLKEHITYPRTGYVSYRKRTPRSRAARIAITAVVSAVTAALVMIVATFSTMQDRMPFVISLPMAGALVYLGYRFGLMRMYVVAALMVLSGYVYSMLALDSDTMIALFFGTLAALMIISGLVTFTLYLLRTRPLSSVEDV